MIQGIFIFLTLLIIGKLFYMQIIDNRYSLSAANNTIRKRTIYPARGIIYDRNGQVLVRNKPIFDLKVTPKDIVNLDTSSFCKVFDISKSDFISRLELAKAKSPYRESILIGGLTVSQNAQISEYIYKFRGFNTNVRTIRYYPDTVAAQLLGYVQEVNERDIEKSNGYYRPGDYIGITGLERSYEEYFRGKRGIENQLVDVFNRPQGSYMEGKYDTLAISGNDLVCSIDKRLQILAEKMMQNKLGSIVAIEPSTGEILTFVSSPTYDPNKVSGRELQKNYKNLINNRDKPMFNRPIQASYPPGSMFKIVSALIGQQAGVITGETIYNCQGGYRYGNSMMRCMHIDGPTNLAKSIKMSCNSYYGFVFDQMMKSSHLNGPESYEKWRKAISKFGLGQRLGIDLPNENTGFIPNSDFYTRRFGNDKWTSSYIMSLSIGQGEMGITPLQMANIMSIVANRGYYYIPHLVKTNANQSLNLNPYKRKIFSGVDSVYFEPVIEGMSQTVNKGGTASSSRINDIEICGKTGTVENPHGNNHAVFVAFAPREKPKIAISVFVENAGYGSTWAAPMASMLIEKYINDTITISRHIKERIFEDTKL